jgi:putative transposase
MPRTPRHVFGGGVYHVLNRGNGRARIFNNESEYRAFLDLMEAGASRFGVRVCSYVLLDNHFHQVLWPREDCAVSAYMHWLTGTHAMQRRRIDRTVGSGHVYQGRFKSFPIQESDYYYNCVSYVEGNALRAELVQRAEHWEWSSLFERLNGGRLVSPGPLELPANWVDLVNTGHSPVALQELRTCARSGRPYGARSWVESAAKEHRLLKKLRPRGRPERK